MEEKLNNEKLEDAIEFKEQLEEMKEIILSSHQVMLRLNLEEDNIFLGHMKALKMLNNMLEEEERIIKELT